MRRCCPVNACARRRSTSTASGSSTHISRPRCVTRSRWPAGSRPAPPALTCGQPSDEASMISPFHTVRVGIRSLRRTPGFTLASIVTLALGIGLSTTVFTVADALLIRPLPVRDQDRIVALWGARRDGSFDNFPLELRDAREFTRRARSLERIAFTTYEGAWPTPVVGPGGDGMSRLRRALV